MNVLAIEWRDERAIQPIDDCARTAVADVLDVLDGVGLRRVRGLDCKHLLEQPGAATELFGHADKVLKEPLVARKQAETGHVTSK